MNRRSIAALEDLIVCWAYFQFQRIFSILHTCKYWIPVYSSLWRTSLDKTYTFNCRHRIGNPSVDIVTQFSYRYNHVDNNCTRAIIPVAVPILDLRADLSVPVGRIPGVMKGCQVCWNAYRAIHIAKVVRSGWSSIWLTSNTDQSDPQDEPLQYLPVGHMSPWWPLLGLLSWCPIIKSCHYNWFKDQAPDLLCLSRYDFLVPWLNHVSSFSRIAAS